MTAYKLSKKLPLVSLVLCLLSACAEPPQSVKVSGNNSINSDVRPNILLIVADDLGYTDIGVYGGEIETPNLDQLARDGVILTDFHNQAVCAPTRAALLSGMDEHNAGGTMHQRSNQRGVTGYESELNKDIVTFPAMLQEGGYKTYWSGKWHLGYEAQQRPVARGFDNAFTLLSSGGSHFNDMRGMFARERKAFYSKNGEDVKSLPEDFYSSDGYTENLIDFIEADRDDGKPWFGFLGFTAPHWPLQAPDDKIEKYKGVYDSGYVELRESRILRGKKLGVIPKDADTFATLESVKPWESLSPEQKRIDAKEMEIYAAMVDVIDENVGRMVTYLKKTGQYDNTFIMFISDNGAEGGVRNPGDNGTDWTFDNSYENMGRIGSHIYYGPEWAQAGVGVMRYYKSFASEGGTRGPAFVHYPKTVQQGLISDAFSTVVDIAPTVLDLAQIESPKSVAGRSVQTLQGTSMLSHLNGNAKNVHPDTEAWGWEVFGHRGIRKAEWKLLWLSAGSSDPGQPKPNNADKWGLYNMETDPGEVHDLSEQHPGIVEDLLAEWDLYVEKNNIILPAP